MGLRHVEVQKEIKKLHQRDYQNYLSSVKLSFMDGEGRQSSLIAKLSSGLGIITGGNGAGKTTLLRGLSRFGEQSEFPWPKHLASVEIHGKKSGQTWHARAKRNAHGTVDLEAVEGDIPSLTFIDPIEQSRDLQRQIAADPNARDLLEGVDCYVLQGDWLAHASRVLQREYDSIWITEFEGPDGSTRPWISVSCEGTEYDLLSMGRGELSALYLMWRLSQVGNDSIVVIDEPESGLAAYAQARLKETLAVISARNGVQFIVTTHSPDMYLGLEGKPVTVLESLPTPVGYEPVSAHKAAQALQAPRSSKLLCVFTEDVVASALLRAILRSAAPQLSDLVEVFYSKNGESALLKVGEEFIEGKVAGRTVRLVTVFDGDQRVFTEGTRSPSDTRAYLPGNEGPESVLVKTTRPLISAMTDEELGEIYADVFNIRMVLAREAGAEHHDWFMALSTTLGGHDATSDILLRICEKDPDFQADVDELISRMWESIRA